MTLPRGRIVPIFIAAGLLVTACGSSPSPAASKNPHSVAVVLREVEAGMKAATSAHMTGTVRQGSQNVSFDMNFVGSDLSGTVTQGSQTVTIMLVSGSAYVKVDQSFLQASSIPLSDCSSMCGKWLAIPASEFNQAARSFTLSYITNLFIKSVPASALTDNSDVFVPATLNGQAVLRFSPSPTTIDVAASGTPYLLYFADPSEGSVTFSQWNAVAPLTAPPASDIITT